VLLATSCGGSDSDGDVAANNDAETETPAETADAGDASADLSEDGTPDVPDFPPPVAVELLQERECAHSTIELGSDDAPEVELPPQEKPVVDDEFLVEVNELIVTDLIVGTGPEVSAGSTIDMQYVGVVTDGTQFDASWDRPGQPFSFTLGSGQVISGWDVGIEGMRVGGRRVLQIPSDLAYGDQARSDVIVANSDLIFIVDLIGASESAPPIDAEQLGPFSGLQIIDLTEGDGCTAEIGDIVTVNYVGIDLATGQEIDNSWARGQPFQVIVGRSQVIDGWNLGIEGMSVGGERILQIPGDLAYGDGDLVFRIHLESLVEAPIGHRVELDGPAPNEITVTTLVEGDGDGAQEGDILDISVAVMLYDSEVIAESSWLNGSPAQIALQADALPDGLEESLRGIQVGETRQIIIPPEEPEVEDELGLEEPEALVFVIEVLRITPAEG